MVGQFKGQPGNHLEQKSASGKICLVCLARTMLGHDKNARFVFGQMDEVQCPTAKTVHLQLPPNIMCQGILDDKSALEFGSCVIQSECSQQHHLVDQIKAPRLDGFIRCSAVCPDH